MGPSPIIRQFSKVHKSTFRAHIVRDLREAIISGEIPAGSQIVEMRLAEQFGVSRGPLREALRQLIDEGLLVTIPYTGTYVAELSAKEVDEIFSVRVNLEIFAYELIWDRRVPEFSDALHERHAQLTEAIDVGDRIRTIETELKLHSLVYEHTGNKILLEMWQSIRGRLQLYWAAHQRAHNKSGPKRDAHDNYISSALGINLDAMRTEIREHMARGRDHTVQFLNRIQLNVR